MTLTNYEKETIINYNEDEKTADIYTRSPPLRRKLERLVADHPEDCRLHRITRDGLGAEFYIPKKWIRINPPRRASEAQIAAARANLQKAKSKP